MKVGAALIAALVAVSPFFARAESQDCLAAKESLRHANTPERREAKRQACGNTASQDKAERKASREQQAGSTKSAAEHAQDVQSSSNRAAADIRRGMAAQPKTAHVPSGK